MGKGEHATGTRTPRPGAQSPPVCIVHADGSHAAAIATELRHHGFRTRHFTGMALLANFLEVNACAALVLDAGLLDEPALPDATRSASSPESAAPVVVLSAEDGMAQRLAAVRAGARAFLASPFNPGVLAQQLRALLDTGDAPAARILLVDTDGNLGDCRRMLADAGLESECAETAEAALTCLRRTPPALLLVDGDARDPEAGELLLALRQYPGAYGIPALVLTAGDKRRFDRIAADAGIEGVVGLPVAAQDLAGIARARLRRAARLRRNWQYLSRRDPFTALHGGAHFHEELRHALAISRQGGQRATLLSLAVGTERDCPAAAITAATSRALQQLIPPPGIATALSGREFAAVIYSREETVIERLKAALRKDLADARPLSGQALPPIHAMIGTALLGPGLESVNEALERARDSARIAAGVAGPAGDSAGFGPGPVVAPDWSHEVSCALEDDRFRLVYQPIANLTGQPTSLYEVFIRMLDRHHNDILPQEFLPAARELGLARHIDRWVVGRALDVLQEQQRRDNPVLFVKLLPETMETASFLVWLTDQIRRTGINPQQLVFQLTQSDAGRQLSEARDLTTGLRKLGCGVALEHYRLSADAQPLLGRLEVDYVKLSAELSRDLARSPERQREVQAIAGEARANEVRVIAALVQDASCLSALWAAGVDYIQGYFMQEPADVFGQEELEDHG